MKSAVERVKAAFEHQDQDTLVRGELWIGRRPFQELRIDDNLEGHINLRNRLGMDLFFLPLSDPDYSASLMDYRRFSVAEIAEAIQGSDLFTGIIVDGPFQRLVEKQGLMPLLTAIKDDEQAVLRRFEKEAADVEAILRQCLKLKVGAVVLADDLAYEHSTYISPDYSDRLLSPLYTNLVEVIQAESAYVLFHSCGNITALLPQLTACGFDGLAACQNRCLDLASLKREYGAQLTFLAGMDADILESESLTATQKKDFGRRITLLAQGGGFILCSSCGLYSRGSIQRLKELYDIADVYLGNG